MEIRNITTDDLRNMEHQEGLILQGCGGDPAEWVEVINKTFTEHKILLENTSFKQVFLFSYEELTCLLFPFVDDVKLNIGRLASWRLMTHEDLGGTWLSDFVPNRLGGYIAAGNLKKPDCPLIGQDGNIFHLISVASGTLKGCGMQKQAQEMAERVSGAGSYEEALAVIGSYVNIVSVEQGKSGEVVDIEGLSWELHRMVKDLSPYEYTGNKALFDTEKDMVKGTCQLLDSREGRDVIRNFLLEFLDEGTAEEPQKVAEMISFIGKLNDKEFGGKHIEQAEDKKGKKGR
ncbi:hypothetical protein [[Clostridium] symbiosum]|uniref:hypothetical protein n=1 Tax=Clostridium symbiosum TaxID=1512 RepID=UPI001AA159BA|nr:hypothetical protein [[Clostridium] symbiosum]